MDTKVSSTNKTFLRMSESESEREQLQSEKSTQSIIDGLNQGSLVTETIKNQQAEIMRKMEETVKAAQQKIRKENAQITEIIRQLGKVNTTVNNLVNQSNRILQSNKQQLEEAIRVTKDDITKNEDKINDVKLKSLLNSLREYNTNKITEFNQIGNVYMSFMKNVYTMAGIDDDKISVPERKNDAFSNKLEEEAGFVSKLGTGIGSYFGFGGTFNIKKTRDVITRIHRDLQIRNEMIQNMIVAIKKVTIDMRLIINDIEGIRNREKSVVLKYLDTDDKSEAEERLVNLYKIPMKSISQISEQFGPLLSGMLEVASVVGSYETSSPESNEEEVAPVATSPPPAAAQVESAPSFWSYLLPSSSPSPATNESDQISKSKPIKSEQQESEQQESKQQESQQQESQQQESQQQESKQQEPIASRTRSKTQLLPPIASRTRSKTQKLHKMDGGSRRRRNHNKTMKSKRWYIRKAKKHVKQKRKYPSRS